MTVQKFVASIQKFTVVPWLLKSLYQRSYQQKALVYLHKRNTLFAPTVSQINLDTMFTQVQLIKYIVYLYAHGEYLDLFSQMATGKNLGKPKNDA